MTNRRLAVGALVVLALATMPVLQAQDDKEYVYGLAQPVQMETVGVDRTLIWLVTSNGRTLTYEAATFTVSEFELHIHKESTGLIRRGA